jgi:hypothetical protein
VWAASVVNRSAIGLLPPDPKAKLFLANAILPHHITSAFGSAIRANGSPQLSPCRLFSRRRSTSLMRGMSINQYLFALLEKPKM